MKATELIKAASTKFTRAASKPMAKVKRYSPEILVAMGVVGVVATVVTACRATTKLHDVIDEHKTVMDDIHEAKSNDEIVAYTDEDAKKDTVIVYTQTAVKLVKLYAPSVALGVLSIGCILASTDIFKKRTAAFAAAYTAVDNGFKEYRKRVIEKFGESVDKELRYGLKKEQIEETVTDEKGKTKVEKREVTTVDSNMPSIYARFFDETCAGCWEKDAEHNLFFLHLQQELANQYLRTNGHLFLNEVYDWLGIPRTKAGQIVGWLYDPNDPDLDNYVDFGIYDVTVEKKRDFVNGYERSILLDFNVTGEIINRI